MFQQHAIDPLTAGGTSLSAGVKLGARARSDAPSTLDVARRLLQQGSDGCEAAEP